jgi:hypothetical protein
LNDKRCAPGNGAHRNQFSNRRFIFKESPMRKSILMFIAAALASAASTPAAALDRNTCDPNLMMCVQGCDSAYVPWDPNWKAYCRTKCESIHRKCSIKHEVTIPVPGWTPPGKFSVIRPPKAESPIRSGGILDNFPGLPSRGPSATGSPMAPASAPSAPPVIIR